MYLLCSMPHVCNGLIHHVVIWAHFVAVAAIVVATLPPNSAH